MANYITDENFAYLWNRIGRLAECKAGYSCRDTYENIFLETISPTYDDTSGAFLAVASFSNFSGLTERVRVIFDGDEYMCTRDGDTYGASENDGSDTWSEYPFSILVVEEDGELWIYTETNASHTVGIDAIIPVASLSECFDIAVRTAMLYRAKMMRIGTNPDTYVINKEYAGILNAIFEGRQVVLWFDNPVTNETEILYPVNISSDTIVFSSAWAYNEDNSVQHDLVSVAINENNSVQYVIHSSVR